jgi:hypothetical protein
VRGELLQPDAADDVRPLEEYHRMRTRFRTVLTAAAATGLVAVALIGCQPAASPDDSVPAESMGTESVAPMSEEPSASPTP